MKKTELQLDFILVEGYKVIAYLSVGQDKRGVCPLMIIGNTSKMREIDYEFLKYVSENRWIGKRDYARIFPAIVAEYIKNKPKYKGMRLYTLPTLIPHP